MKKHILKAMVVVSCLACATSAFASPSTITSVGTSIGGGLFRPSASVTIIAYSDGANYVATSQHSSSNSTNSGKMYGTSNLAAVMSTATASDTGTPTPPASSTAIPF